jgi:hypothetical protein
LPLNIVIVCACMSLQRQARCFRCEMSHCKVRREMEMRAVKIVSCAAIVWLVAGSFVFAGDDPNVSVTIASDFLSKYIWRGQNIVNDWVAQPSVSLGYKGFTASIWSNFCLTNKIDARDEFTEFDYSLDYTAAIPGQDLLSFSVGTIYYRFPNQPFDPTLEVYGGLSASLPLSPAVKVFYDVGNSLDQDKIEGNYIQFSIGHSIEKIQKWTEECYCDLQLGASVGYATAGYDKGYFGVDSAAFNDLTLSAGLPITLGNWTIKPQVGYSTMLDSDIRAATDKSDNLFGGIGASYQF